MGIASKLEYIIAGYCMGFFSMGFGFGMVVIGEDSGHLVFVLGFGIIMTMISYRTTSPTMLRRYRLPETD